MLWGGHKGGLELRHSADGSIRLQGRFPYGAATVLSNGRVTKSEVFEARAFRDRIEADEDIYFLSGHDFEKPLASRSAGTLILTDTDEALTFEATISAELRSVSYVADAVGAIEAGLIKGVSPGFRVSAKEGAERVEKTSDGLRRVVRSADLFEISAVTKPAYPQAQIEARSWAHEALEVKTPKPSHLNRWRL
jgi:HK97 family phage prohead protease